LACEREKPLVLTFFDALSACSKFPQLLPKKATPSLTGEFFPKHQMFFCRFCFEKKINPFEDSFLKQLKTVN
jgi:hypothetical protein